MSGLSEGVGDKHDDDAQISGMEDNKDSVSSSSSMTGKSVAGASSGLSKASHAISKSSSKKATNKKARR